MRQKQKADAGGTSTGLRFLDGHRRSRLHRGIILPLPISPDNFLDTNTHFFKKNMRALARSTSG
jgi:hypothetical protein